MSDLRQDTATRKRLEHSRLLQRLAYGDQEVQNGQGYALNDVLGEAAVFFHGESV